MYYAIIRWKKEGKQIYALTYQWEDIYGHPKEPLTAEQTERILFAYTVSETERLCRDKDLAVDTADQVQVYIHNIFEWRDDLTLNLDPKTWRRM